MSNPITLEGLVAALRAWSAGQEPHVQAAVELLIDHRHWLHDPLFVEDCVHYDERREIATITWSTARTVFNDYRAEPTELAILDFAIALGENRYRLSQMDPREAQMLARAAVAALGIPIR